MGRKGYLIDSNAVIDYLGNKLPVSGTELMNDVIDATPIVSVITKIEVLGFNTTNENDLILKDFFEDSIVVGLTNEIVGICVALRKKHQIKLPDAIIAATALELDYALLTRNISDFDFIKGIKLINPHDINEGQKH